MHFSEFILKLFFLTFIILFLLILIHIDWTSLDTIVESIHNEVLLPPLFTY